MAASKANLFNRVSTAVFYGICSFLIVVINKNVLTTYKFPSFQFLGIGQMLATIVVLYGAKMAGYIKFPNYNRSMFLKVSLSSLIKHKHQYLQYRICTFSMG
ncbi:UDP-sugar transporter sqv-7-like [Exaiptasia diaphana]|uniref:Uncharacterized protein n=1 Tax=Exaiptasia diaphana TaxID=2652724 RepID=A0A913Y642_EXADI|nr:UDP-sugar transporter sqv-7-like [Exaiptasia diaphana]